MIGNAPYRNVLGFLTADLLLRQSAIHKSF
jgi:hypothetical protein